MTTLFRCKKIATNVSKMLFISNLSILESRVSAQASKGFMGLTRNMTLLIAGVGGAFVVILIGIIGVICFVRKIHKNSTPASTPVNSRPTSQQEQAEMDSVRHHMLRHGKKEYLEMHNSRDNWMSNQHF